MGHIRYSILSCTRIIVALSNLSLIASIGMKVSNTGKLQNIQDLWDEALEGLYTR